MKKLLSVVIPIYNEKGNIKELYNKLIKVLLKDFIDFNYEIIFVDDGSTDNSIDILQGLKKADGNIKVLQFSRNFGHHIAITAGLDNATGDFVVMMDGDGQDQPEEIIKLYNKLSDGYDVVYGERLTKQFSFIKVFLSKIFNFIIKKLIDENIVINSTIFRIMNKQVVDNINKLREHDRYIIGIIGWVGFKHTSQKVIHGKRMSGESKYNFYRQLKLALNAIFSFSNYSLRLITKIGLLFVFISFFYALLLVYNKIFFDIPILGYTSIMASILLIGGIQIITLGVIGEYVGRSYIENKKRPLYILK